MKAAAAALKSELGARSSLLTASSIRSICRSFQTAAKHTSSEASWLLAIAMWRMHTGFGPLRIGTKPGLVGPT